MILVIAVLVWFAWSRSFSSTDRAISLVSTHLPSSTFMPVITPILTASNTVTPTHTPALTSTPTATPKKTSSPTPTVTLTPSPTLSPTKVVHSQNIYTVKRGETLAKIAAKFNCDLNELMRRNNIDNASTVKQGTRLVIPMDTTGGAGQNKGASPPASVRKSGKSILVDISEQHMYAYEGKKLVLSFNASTGRNGSTFTGTFSILDKIPKAWSAPWGFWMPHWMGIYYVGSNLENGFHSLPVLTNGQEIWGDEIGVPITYGCVVLDPGDMKRLFNWAEIGTPVLIRQ